VDQELTPKRRQLENLRKREERPGKRVVGKTGGAGRKRAHQAGGTRGNFVECASSTEMTTRGIIGAERYVHKKGEILKGERLNTYRTMGKKNADGVRTSRRSGESRQWGSKGEKI